MIARWYARSLMRAFVFALVVGSIVGCGDALPDEPIRGIEQNRLRIESDGDRAHVLKHAGERHFKNRLVGPPIL